MLLLKSLPTACISKFPFFITSTLLLVYKKILSLFIYQNRTSPKKSKEKGRISATFPLLYFSFLHLINYLCKINSFHFLLSLCTGCVHIASIYPCQNCSSNFFHCLLCILSRLQKCKPKLFGCTVRQKNS